ncbi:unannotated protein [freshwater metagenome]|uniref:Unannotated protein n=1 Tax=freshwater metagenome TaxID=449393 RepID=A0A6J6VYB7_9ZZZZ
MVYAASRADVLDVWVDGKQVVDNRSLTTIDLPATLALVREIIARF